MNLAGTISEIPDLRIVAFDLDDTLSPSKTPIDADMAQAFTKLLDVVQVLIISGGRFEQFQMQVLDRLPDNAKLADLHIMPTNGTRYLRFVDGQWKEIYFHALNETEAQTAWNAVEEEAKRLGYWEPDEKVNGSRIENRGSQITFSALGQQAAVGDKAAWDTTGEKREALRQAVADRLPLLEVRAGGSTSVDITRKGIDKAYGMRSLKEHTGIELDQMIFIGDRLMPGGNDYPVLELGVKCIPVTSASQTVTLINEIINRFKEE